MYLARGRSPGRARNLPSLRDLRKYARLFQRLDTDADGRITGPEARDTFSRSGLSAEVLMRIWDMVDNYRAGLLSFPEFVGAMHLIRQARLGQLPYDLVLPHELASFLGSIQDSPANLALQGNSRSASAARTASAPPSPAAGAKFEMGGFSSLAAEPSGAADAAFDAWPSTMRSQGDNPLPFGDGQEGGGGEDLFTGTSTSRKSKKKSRKSKGEGEAVPDAVPFGEVAAWTTFESPKDDSLGPKDDPFGSKEEPFGTKESFGATGSFGQEESFGGKAPFSFKHSSDPFATLKAAPLDEDRPLSGLSPKERRTSRPAFEDSRGRPEDPRYQARLQELMGTRKAQDEVVERPISPYASVLGHIHPAEAGDGRGVFRPYEARQEPAYAVPVTTVSRVPPSQSFLRTLTPNFVKGSSTPSTGRVLLSTEAQFLSSNVSSANVSPTASPSLRPRALAALQPKLGFVHY